jgi:hypothetical protein
MAKKTETLTDTVLVSEIQKLLLNERNTIEFALAEIYDIRNRLYHEKGIEADPFEIARAIKKILMGRLLLVTAVMAEENYETNEPCLNGTVNGTVKVEVKFASTKR